MRPEIAAEWRRRVDAEYRSAAHTNQVVGWLIEVGASPTLIHDGLRIVGDELVHAELSAQVLAAAGGEPAPIAPASLRLGGRIEGGAAGALPLVRAILEIYCIGETVAVPLFRTMLAGASEPVVRRALTRIVRDEARHRRFGWECLDWLRSVSTGLDGVIAAETPVMLDRVRAAYDVGEDTRLEPECRAWGLISGAEYAAGLREAQRVWWGPRFKLTTPGSLRPRIS